MAVQDVLSTKHVKERRKSKKKIWSIRLFILPLHSLKGNTDKSLRHGIFLRDLGTLADRLGNGLQNRVEQFDSARYLFQPTKESLQGIVSCRDFFIHNCI